MARTFTLNADGRDKIIPGQPLEVAVRDRNSVMSKNFSSIQLQVWTDKTQDREILTLAQIDAAGELFSGGLPTEMGDGTPNDGRIQVLGDDVIHYDLSDDFVRKTNYIRTRPTKVSMRVLSDGSLYATSGEILSAEERERQQMEELFAKENRIEVEEDSTPLSEVRPENVIRPGNPINMQVTDLNANIGTGPDEVLVRIESSSGDSVTGLILTETGKHTATFEGSVATARLPAQAFASDSSTATDPNQVISPLNRPSPGRLPAMSVVCVILVSISMISLILARCQFNRGTLTGPLLAWRFRHLMITNSLLP